jgi:anti-repressor protein
MNELITIHGVRGFVDKNGTVQLNIEDVARGLGFTTVATSGNECVRWSRVAEYLTSFNFQVQGASYDDTFIPENIFYRLAMKAKNETAEIFQAKVADEILPSIRKHGMYATDELLDNPDLLIQVATELKKAREEKKLLEDTIEQQKPQVLFAASVTASSTSILVADLAKILKKNGIDIGEIRLWEWLRKNKYVISEKGRSYNMPTQKSMELKVMEIKEGTYINSKGVSKITKTTLVTGKGQVYFVNKFLKEKEESLCLTR